MSAQKQSSQNMRSTRRSFIAASVGTTAGLSFRSGFSHVRRFGNETIIGSDDHQFRVTHHFPQLPDHYSWQTTHNVAVDSSEHLYVIHEGRKDRKDHPAIFVFDPDGKFIRAFGSEFQGGGHGIEVRREGQEEFLYVCGYQGVKAFAKMTLQGEIVWFRKAPMESNAYAVGENLSTEPNWSRKGFLPTNVAFLDDGGFLLADGYGSYNIHRYDTNANWVSCFGGEGNGQGTFHTPHGIWVDRRPDKHGVPRNPSIVVCDRAHNTLQLFAMDGTYQETLNGFGLPANLDTWRTLMVVPELKACVTLLDEANRPVVQLGKATSRLAEIKNLRAAPKLWREGEFIHPHDACFTADGSIFVAEWVATGRITKLERIS